MAPAFPKGRRHFYHAQHAPAQACVAKRRAGFPFLVFGVVLNNPHLPRREVPCWSVTQGMYAQAGYLPGGLRSPSGGAP